MDDGDDAFFIFLSVFYVDISMGTDLKTQKITEHRHHLHKAGISNLLAV